MTVASEAMEVVGGRRPFALICGDSLDVMRQMPADVAALVFGSPPYLEARLYLENGKNLGVARKCEQWVEWMLEMSLAAARLSVGPVCWVAAGSTKDRNYRPAVEGLIWEWYRRGGDCHQYRPSYWHRVGICGSGGDDYFRADVEYVTCFKRPGKLPFSDNTACGHPPKWAPGGEMSNRLPSGARVNQWGLNVRPDGTLTATSRGRDGTSGPQDERRRRTVKPSHQLQEEAPFDDAGLFGEPAASEPAGNDGFNGRTNKPGRKKDGGTEPRQKLVTRRAPRGHADGDVRAQELYTPPVLANPGVVIQQTYTADEVAALLARAGDAFHTKTGGGNMGHVLAHENEAPFPEAVAERFILSFTRPGDLVIEPFLGSGTTVAVAVRHGRRAIGIDLRESQLDIARRRIATVTPMLFAAGTGERG